MTLREAINFRKHQRALRYAYVKEHAPALLRPGVTFTPEQERLILEMIEDGQEMEAQRMILNELQRQFPEAQP